MDITFLQISTGSYRTTNPPVSESRTWTVSKEPVPFGEPRLLFRVKESYNASERQAEYPLTRAQYDEIVGLFERLRLQELLLARLNETPAPVYMPPMAGGSSRTILSFTANGVTVTAADPPQEMSALTQHLQTLRNAFADDTSTAQPAPMPPMAGVAPAPPMAGVTPAPTAKPESAAGEWYCPACGQPNRGAFCTECGQKKK